MFFPREAYYLKRVAAHAPESQSHRWGEGERDPGRKRSREEVGTSADHGQGRRRESRSQHTGSRGRADRADALRNVGELRRSSTPAARTGGPTREADGGATTTANKSPGLVAKTRWVMP
jgi:hypothetical protein